MTVDFKNTIIIMTSNLGSQYAFETDAKAREDHYLEEVHKFFKPELINRIDEIIVFNALDESVLVKIAEKFLRQLEERLRAKDVTLEVTENAKKRMIACGVDPLYGARPMKRHIQREVETQVARVILENPDIAGKTILVDADEDHYLVSVK